VRLRDGWHGAGREGVVLDDEVHVGQPWCPVLWDDEEDPDFHKSAGLEPIGRETDGAVTVSLTLLVQREVVADSEGDYKSRRDSLLVALERAGWDVGSVESEETA